MSRQTQLNIVRAAGQRRFYDWIDFGEFRPELAGVKVRVHVNPPRAVRRNLEEVHKRIWELQEELKALSTEASKLEVEISEAKEREPLPGVVMQSPEGISKQERLDRISERIAAINAERLPLGIRNNEIVASLLPTSDTDDTPLTIEELGVFLEGDDTDDDTLEVWFLRAVWAKVYDYFLSSVTSQGKSKVGNTP
jgi:hypothetical protein